MNPPNDRNAFTIALICALSLEAECVLAILDSQWDDAGYAPLEADLNAYTLGSIGAHHVVIVHMPSMGTTSAAGVAAHLQRSFPNVHLAIVVGICGGVPCGAKGDIEVVLGDVMVSSALVQYDSGREYPRGFQVRTRIEDSLGRASLSVRSYMNKCRTTQYRQKLEGKARTHLQELHIKVPSTVDPGMKNDRLFNASYPHQHRKMAGNTICHTCDQTQRVCQEAVEASCDQLGCESRFLVERSRLQISNHASSTPQSRPSIFFTTIASGNKVMKSARERDRLAREMGIGAFEMEGAGIWEYIPTIVIKGVTDYADSHKSKQFQMYAAATSAACTKALLAEWPAAHVYPSAGLNTSEAHSGSVSQGLNEATASQPAAWTVPFSGLSHFVGRRQEFAALEAKLFDLDGPHRAAIVGPAGIGKTRLAFEVANSFRSRWPSASVLWVQGSDTQTVDRDLSKIGKALRIPGVEDQNADVRLLIQQGLCQPSSGKWLFILDNADDEILWGPNGSLVDHLPSSAHGAVIITTRTLRVGFQLATNNLIDLHPMQKDEALSLFEQGMIDSSKDFDQRMTIKLMEKLGYFPLAIVQATAYMVVNRTSPVHYLELLEDTEQNVVELLDEEFQVDGRYRESTNSVLSTWKISFEQIRSRDQLAADYLSFMCCLNEHQIPKSILMEGSSLKKTNDAIGLLKAYSLVSEQDGQFSMHNLVRLAVRNWLQVESLIDHYTEKAIRRLDTIFPGVSFQSKSVWASYLPHAKLLCESSLCHDIEAKYNLLNRVGLCLLWSGRYAEAVDKLELAVNWMAPNLGKTDERVLYVYANFGRALVWIGDMERAEKCLTSTYEQSVSSLGFGNKTTQDCITTLSILYGKQGRYKQAESMLTQLYETRKKALGTTHQNTLSTATDLSWVYMMQERTEEAAALTESVTDSQKLLLGLDHPNTLSSMSVLTNIYLEQKRYEEAETICKDLLERSTKSNGLEHPATLGIMYSLAGNYYYRRRYDVAEDLIVQTIELQNRTLGACNPDTMRSRFLLAYIIKKTGRDDEAKTLLQQCVEWSIEKLGSDHPDTKTPNEILQRWTKEDEQQRTTVDEAVDSAREKYPDDGNKTDEESGTAGVKKESAARKNNDIVQNSSSHTTKDRPVDQVSREARSSGAETSSRILAHRPRPRWVAKLLGRKQP